MVPVEFHFDFGSPNAYLSHLVIPEIEQRTGVEFAYVPVLLGGRLEMERFLRRHGITRFRFNPFFPVNTLTPMRGAVAARSLGIFDRYVDEVYRHMWADPKKMDDPSVFRAALDESGLEAERILALVETREIKDQLLENTRRSVERGTFGSPTFFVGDEMFFGKDRLREVEEMILARR